MDDRVALAALSAIVEPGRSNVMKRVATVGPERTWHEILRGDSCIDRSGRLGRLAAGVDGRAILRRAETLGIRFVCPGDDEWPEVLDNTWQTLELQEPVPPPAALYVRGSGWLPDLTKRAVTLVGSRAASSYGERVAGDLAADLAMDDWSVISGGAYGIDAAAHRGALAVDGVTVAVLACGVDVPYPRTHESLLARMTDRGVVVGEVPPGAHPTRSRFLDRNRLIAALGGGTVVVEAARRSGALSTANWAARLSRPVMAVPGPVTSAMSAGCHDLIRQDCTLVTSAAEIADVVGDLGADALEQPRSQQRPADALPPSTKETLDALHSYFPRTVAELVTSTGLEQPTIETALKQLHRAGLAEETLAGWHIVRGGS